MSTINSFKYLTPITKETPPEELKALWESLKDEDYAFDDHTRGNPEVFIRNLYTPGTAHFKMDEAGYLVVSDIRAGINAAIHYAVWKKDYPMRSIINAGKEIIDWLFDELKVNRVTSAIPSFNKSTTRLVTILGFRYEGAIRSSFLSHEKFYDVLIYGLLKSEWEKIKCR